MSRDAPAHPAKATGTSWRSVVADYQLEQHHVRLLSLAAEARDRAQEAQEEIAAAGAYFTAINPANKRLAELHIEPISERVSPSHCDEPTTACGRP